MKLTAYDFFPSGRLAPWYTSNRLTSFNTLFSVCFAIVKICSNATFSSTNNAKSRRTSGYLGMSVNLILVVMYFCSLSQLKSANTTSCLMSKCFRIDFLMVPNSTMISFPMAKANPSANTSLANGKLFTFWSMPNRLNTAITYPFTKKKSDFSWAFVQLSALLFPVTVNVRCLSSW